MTKASVSTADLAKLVDTVGRAVDGLKALKKQLVNTKLLQETQAGKRIRALSKHSDASVARLAGEVVFAWKDVVRRENEATPSSSQKPQQQSQEEQQQQQASQQSRPASAGGAAPATAAAATAAGAVSRSEVGYRLEGGGAAGGSSSQATSAAAGGNLAAAAAAEFNGTGLPKTGDAMAVLEGAGGSSKIASLAVAVETAVFAAHGGVTAAYKAKFRNLHFNLKDEKNPDLRRRVLTGEVAPEVLVTLPPEELASDAKREENQLIREKKLFHSERGPSKQATTDAFQCGKCKQRKCTYYQMQTRSADEPMTTFVTCLNCNNSQIPFMALSASMAASQAAVEHIQTQ
ncbi:hypothetical protein N2152v2_005570 [Parachlorella kessleri]